jgi:hypothetical protein
MPWLRCLAGAKIVKIYLTAAAIIHKKRVGFTVGTVRLWV